MAIAHDKICSEKLDLAASSLIVVLSSSDGSLRQLARRSLVAIGDAAVEPLIATLKGSDRNVRWEAAKALGEIGNPAAAPALVSALEDDAFGVRWLAAEGLIAMGRPALRPLLEALIHNPDSGWIREGAHHILRVLAGKGLRDLVMPLVMAMENYEHAADIVPAARELERKLDDFDHQDREQSFMI